MANEQMSIRTVGLHHVNVLPFCWWITRLLYLQYVGLVTTNNNNNDNTNKYT